jgi:hypothetical protein
MTRTRLVLAGLLLLGAATLSTGAAPTTRIQGGAFGTDVQIEPSSKAKGGFSIRVKVTDLSSGMVVAAPGLIVPAGEVGEASSDLPGQRAVAVSAKVDPEGHEAHYSITMKEGDQIVSSHTAKVILQ